MKTIQKILLPLIFLCQILLGQTALAETQVADDKATNVSQTNIPANLQPIDIFKTPNLLADQWLTEPIPLSSYTEEEKRLQRLINDKTATAVQTYSTKAQDNEWTQYDHDEITPYTWKVLELDLTESNGKTFPTSLLRPNWWIRNIGADRKGNRFYLKIPEVVEGWAVVKNIRVNQLDTRLWDEARKGDFVYRPVTATFQHDSNNVQQLYFTGNDTPLEVTPEHPIYSIDRNDFVHAGSLRTGEQVKTRQGITTLEQRKQLSDTHRVYNLEVYRDHNFMVSMDSILVHNSRDKGSYVSLNQKINLKQDAVEVRAGLPSKLRGGGNVAVADIQISGLSTKKMSAHSGIEIVKPTHKSNSLVGEGSGNFKATYVRTKEGRKKFADNDSEYKIFDNLADKLGKNSQASGSVVIYTERRACKSCLGVANQFRQKYPNIDVQIIHHGSPIYPNKGFTNKVRNGR